jgi:hypothetical protein
MRTSAIMKGRIRVDVQAVDQCYMHFSSAIGQSDRPHQTTPLLFCRLWTTLLLAAICVWMVA